ANGTREPSGLRCACRTHLDEDLDAADSQRLLKLTLADTGDVAQQNALRVQRLARADDDAAALAVEPHDVKRPAGRDAKTLAPPDGEIDDAGVMAEHLAAQIDDFAGLRRTWLETLNHIGIVSARYKADILTVLLVRHRKHEAASELARLRLAALA